MGNLPVSGVFLDLKEKRSSWVSGSVFSSILMYSSAISLTLSWSAVSYL